METPLFAHRDGGEIYLGKRTLCLGFYRPSRGLSQNLKD